MPIPDDIMCGPIGRCWNCEADGVEIRPDGMCYDCGFMYDQAHDRWLSEADDEEG